MTLLKVVAILILATAIPATAQQASDHAPTTDQCRADRSLWWSQLFGGEAVGSLTPSSVSEAQVAANLTRIPYRTLASREDEMSVCMATIDLRPTFRNEDETIQSWQNAGWYQVLVTRYLKEMVRRESNFINSHGYGSAFLAETDPRKDQK